MEDNMIPFNPFLNNGDGGDGPAPQGQPLGHNFQEVNYDIDIIDYYAAPIAAAIAGAVQAVPAMLAPHIAPVTYSIVMEMMRVRSGLIKSLGISETLDLPLDQTHPTCLLYTSPSPRDRTRSRMPSSA